MTALSRRQVLGGFVTLLAGGSGCASPASQGTPTDTATVGERTFSHCVPNPTTRQIRHPEGKPAIRSSAFTPAWDWSSTKWVITSPSERDALDYSTVAAGVDATKEFVDDTDLSAQTVLVHQHTFDDCLALQLERLKWKRSEYPIEGGFDFGLEYADTERDENCGRDTSEYTIATVTRVPAKVEKIGRFTWGTMAIGQNDC